MQYKSHFDEFLQNSIRQQLVCSKYKKQMGSKYSKPEVKKGQILCIGSSIKSLPSHIKAYGKTFKPGSSPLSGVKKDLHIMYKWAIQNKIDYKGSIQFGSGLLVNSCKKQLISKINKLFWNSEGYATTYVYYSGHGDIDGNWVLQTSKGIQYVSPEDILQQWARIFMLHHNRTLQIILDQCFSGKWFQARFPPPSWETIQLGNGGCTFRSPLLPQQIRKQPFYSQIIIRASCKAQQKSQDWGQDIESAFTSTTYGGNKDMLSQNPQTRELFFGPIP